MKKSKHIAIPVLCAAIIALSSCATIINGPSQTVPVTSSRSGEDRTFTAKDGSIKTVPASPVPLPGALITDNGVVLGRTPAMLELARKVSHFIVLTLDGFEPCETLLEVKGSWAAMGNVLLGGLPGIGVDALTGSSKKLVPKKVNCVMVPIEMGP